MNNGRSPIIILPLPFFVIPYIPLTQSHFKTLFLYLVCSDNRQKCVPAACITLTHTCKNVIHMRTHTLCAYDHAYRFHSTNILWCWEHDAGCRVCNIAYSIERIWDWCRDWDSRYMGNMMAGIVHSLKNVSVAAFNNLPQRTLRYCM